MQPDTAPQVTPIGLSVDTRAALAIHGRNTEKVGGRRLHESAGQVACCRLDRASAYPNTYLADGLRSFTRVFRWGHMAEARFLCCFTLGLLDVIRLA